MVADAQPGVVGVALARVAHEDPPGDVRVGRDPEPDAAVRARGEEIKVGARGRVLSGRRVG